MTVIKAGGPTGSIHKFGRNQAVGAGAYEPVNSSGTSPHISAAEPFRIRAGGNAADDASGANARSVTLVMIDSSGREVERVLATAGIAASVSTPDGWRINRAFVSEVGAYGNANAGDIVIEGASTSTEMVRIVAGAGQTLSAIYTVPIDAYAKVTSMTATVDGNQAANVRLCTRKRAVQGAPFRSMRIQHFAPGITNSRPYSLNISLDPGEDVWAEAIAKSGTTSVSVEFDIEFLR